MTLSKLSLRNAKRQAKDYLVYFITIVMAAAFIYAFNGLVFSDELKSLSAFMEMLPLITVLISIVVVCIIGWLISYTTQFMLERRSRELGTYILIGLENRQVAQLFFLENLVVGAVALVLGLLFGNLIFQALRAITLSLFKVTYQFHFDLSIKAVALSFFYFAIMYLFALLKSRRIINRMKIHDLLYFDRQNEGEVIHRERTRRRVFVWSIVLGLLGTGLILLGNLAVGLLGAAMIIVFLYGFFISFSSGVPEYFRRRPRQKYTGHTLLVFRALTAKLGTMGVVMATIALLFTATVVAEGTGLVFNVLFQDRAETTCYDLYIASVDGTKSSLKEYRSYIDHEIPVRDSWEYPVYLADNTKVLSYVEENAEYYRMFDFDTIMKASDYIALRAMLGYSAAELKPGQYIIHCQRYLGNIMEAYQQPLEVGGQTLTQGAVYTESFTQSLWNGNGRGYLLVVPDEAVKNQPVSHQAYAAMTLEPVADYDYKELMRIVEEKDAAKEDYGRDTIFSKATLEAENAALCATINFPLYYLALVLIMVAATILTLHQLSESNRYHRQFRLLKSLGMDEQEMHSALRKQFIIFYAMPALPPILIGTPLIIALGAELDAGVMEPGQILTTTALALGLFFAIYLIYILAAYINLKRSVFEK